MSDRRAPRLSRRAAPRRLALAASNPDGAGALTLADGALSGICALSVPLVRAPAPFERGPLTLAVPGDLP